LFNEIYTIYLEGLLDLDACLLSVLALLLSVLLLFSVLFHYLVLIFICTHAFCFKRSICIIYYIFSEYAFLSLNIFRAAFF